MKCVFNGLTPPLPFSLLLAFLYASSLVFAIDTDTPTSTVAMDFGADLIQRDECASFRTNLGQDLKHMLHLPWMVESRETELCLCTSTVSNFISHGNNRPVEIAKAIAGEAKVTEALKELIQRHSPKTCPSLPTHASRQCNSAGRGSSICDFTCQHPFWKDTHGKKCVLPASGHPKPKKRSLEDQIAIAATKCLPGQVVCGKTIHSSMEPSGRFDCMDVSNDLFNCGGCAAGALGVASEVLGVDCSEIPGVHSVQCSGGRCNVTQCALGWFVGPSKENCVRVRYG